MAISNTDSGYGAYSSFDAARSSANSQNLFKSGKSSYAAFHIKHDQENSAGRSDVKDSVSKFKDYDTIRDTYEPADSSADYGNTVGTPKLSDTAAEYYEELKKKYSNLNFVLVSSDEKDDALAKAARFNNGTQITAVIDEEQLERMASDPEYREKMESYIDSAIDSLNSLQQELDDSGLSDMVAGLGIQINDDGSVSYFAILKDMAAAQKERIEEALSEKRTEAKEEKKDAERERLEALREELPGGREEALPEEQFDMLPGEQMEIRPEEQPEKVPADREEALPEEQPDMLPGEQMGIRPEGQPEKVPAGREEYIPENPAEYMPEEQPGKLPDMLPGEQTEHLHEEQFDMLPDEQMGIRPEGQPDILPDERMEAVHKGIVSDYRLNAYRSQMAAGRTLHHDFGNTVSPNAVEAGSIEELISRLREMSASE